MDYIEISKSASCGESRFIWKWNDEILFIVSADRVEFLR